MSRRSPPPPVGVTSNLAITLLLALSACSPPPAAPARPDVVPRSSATRSPVTVRFIAEKPAPRSRSEVGIVPTDSVHQTICQAWSRFGPAESSGGKVIFGVRDTKHDRALVLDASSGESVLVRTPEKEVAEGARAELIAALAGFLASASPVDCQVEVVNGPILIELGVRDGKPFAKIATFDRTLTVLVARAAGRTPAEPPEFQRDDQLVIHWKNGSEAERARNAQHLPRVQQAARRVLRDSVVREHPVFMKIHCDYTATLEEAAKLTSAEDQKLVAEARERFCR
jgi:hypothetical protein